MSSWKKNFQDATTNVAFQLSLSRNMVLVLADIACASKQAAKNGISPRHCYAAGIYRDIWFPAVQALKRRGLVESVSDRPDRPDLTTLVVTEAGECVFALCRIADLVPDLDAKPANTEAAA